MTESFDVGIDVGGTHVDVVVAGSETPLESYKSTTEPNEPTAGIIAGLHEVAADKDLELREFVGRVDSLVYATTVSTNALIEGEEATTGLVTTRGFRDVLELVRGHGSARDVTANATGSPLPRFLRREVTERITDDGTVKKPLDGDEFVATAEQLLDDGAEAIAVAFLHSHVNDEHEERARALANESDCDHWSFSASVHNEIRLYERATAAVVDASLKPIFRDAIDAFCERLDRLGFEGSLFVMQGNGGTASRSAVEDRPILSVNSGPASGAYTTGTVFGETDGSLLSLDVGGTSTDICVVRDGRPAYSTEVRVGNRLVPIPIVDVETIGSGGGSIAYVDDRGTISVGPESVGADPGPACYDRGNVRPTVTDACLVLGYLERSHHPEDGRRLNVELARDALRTEIADPLGIDVIEAASGVLRIVCTGIANVARRTLIGRGLDPHDASIVAYGGAGPILAPFVARELNSDVIVPRLAGTFSAFGLLHTDVRFVESESLSARPLSGVDDGRIADQFDALEDRIRSKHGISDSTEYATSPVLKTRYAGQFHELTVELPADGIDRESIRNAHHEQHRSTYAYAYEDSEIELLGSRLTLTVETDIRGSGDGDTERMTDSVSGSTEVRFPESDETFTIPRYDGRSPLVGRASGPGLVTLEGSVILVPPDFEIRNETGNAYELTFTE